jgi:hypothetical protein
MREKGKNKSGQMITRTQMTSRPGDGVDERLGGDTLLHCGCQCTWLMETELKLARFEVTTTRVSVHNLHLSSSACYQVFT